MNYTKSSDILENPEDSLTFSDSKHLNALFISKDFKRASRNKRSLNEDHGERCTLRLYLLLLSKMNKLQYPFIIRKSESPDFIIESSFEKTGIEIRQLTTTKLERDKSKCKPGSKYALIGYGATGHSLVKHGEPLSMDPLEGNAGISIYTSLFFDSLENKTTKLNSTHWEKSLKSNELVIFDTYKLPLDTKNKRVQIDLIESLKDCVVNLQKKSQYLLHFSKVSLIINGVLYYDIGNDYSVLETI